MNTTSPFDSIRQFFRSKSALSVLILINVAVFLFVNLIGLVWWLLKITPLEGDSGLSLVTWWLGVHAWIPQIIAKPWTILTYMFVQEEFLHILFNMMVLYFGGQLFTSFFDQRKLVSTYLMGGISGAFLYILFYNIFPVFHDVLPGAVAIGASASVLSILVAAATYAPNTEVGLILIGRVKLKYLALFLVVLDVFSIKQGNAGGHIAHLGGAMWGFFYVTIINKVHAFKAMNFYLEEFFKKIFRKKKTFRKTYVNERPLNDDDYNKIKVEKQAKMDRILDKISKSGYEKLTKDEKEFLFNSRRK